MNFYTNPVSNHGVARINLYECIKAHQGANPAVLEETKEMVILIDISGSMAGSLIDAAKRAACNLIDQYPERRVRVVAFDENLIIIGASESTELVTPTKIQPRLALIRAEKEEPPKPQYTEGVYSDFQWTSAASPDEKEAIKARIRTLQARGSTAFVSACMFAAFNAPEGACVVALTDGLNNDGLGFDRCQQIGSIFRDRFIQFTLVVPFSDFNYCDLSSLKHLYTECDGDVLYPRVNEIEQAFAESQVPIAYKTTLTVKAQGAESRAIPVPKVTRNSVLYIRFGSEQPVYPEPVFFRVNPYDLQTCPLEFHIEYQGFAGNAQSIPSAPVQSGDQSIAQEFLTKSLALQLKNNQMSGSRTAIRDYIENVCQELGLAEGVKKTTLDIFNVINELVTTPGLAKTPSQGDHVQGLLHALSSNPSTGVPANLERALTDAREHMTKRTPHFPDLQ